MRVEVNINESNISVRNQTTSNFSEAEREQLMQLAEQWKRDRVGLPFEATMLRRCACGNVHSEGAGGVCWWCELKSRFRRETDAASLELLSQRAESLSLDLMALAVELRDQAATAERRPTLDVHVYPNYHIEDL